MRLRTQKHTLERHSEEREVQSIRIWYQWYECTKCEKSWKNKPYRADCQGIPNYQIRKERPKHLFTINELAKKHKKPEDIRKPEGYVQMLNAPYWIYLYDINTAVPDEG